MSVFMRAHYFGEKHCSRDSQHLPYFGRHGLFHWEVSLPRLTVLLCITGGPHFMNLPDNCETSVHVFLRQRAEELQEESLVLML